MKEKITSKTKLMVFFLLFIGGILFTASAQAQNDGARLQRTIIVSTLDGTTMEYLIDKNTKVRVEKPNLVIETEGVTLSYELEKMGQLRYGRSIAEGISAATTDNPFSFDNETLYFKQLPKNSLIEIYTIDGKRTTTRRCSGRASISLTTLSPGAYIVKVNVNSYKIVKK